MTDAAPQISPLISPLLPPRFRDWFSRRGWTPREHQLDMIAAAQAGQDALLIAPTGGGKTLAGFLPSLIDLSQRGPRNDGKRLHTLYISPLKALAVDVHRNLLSPILELGLPITAEGIETREVLDKLVELGEFKGQGYFYGLPAPAADVNKMLAARNLLATDLPVELAARADKPSETPVNAPAETALGTDGPIPAPRRAGNDR